MTANLGNIDRGIRLLLAIVLLAAPFVTEMRLFDSGVATTISVLLGLVLLGTSALRFCPLYRLFGVNTCKL